MEVKIEDIAIESFNTKIFKVWYKTCFVLTSGDFAEHKFNSMTVGWGAMGTMWSLPFVMVVVRPTRYTFGFINQYDSFSICAFPEAYREALNILGTCSGRDSDKVAASGLTPIALSDISAPGYKEADLTIQCKRSYWQDLDPGHFLDPRIEDRYPEKDYHRMVFGEVLSVRGDQRKYG